jgi:type IV pili sensor histidine kinase/response regulator
LIEPINAVASLTFPRQTVRTIRQAVDFTLMRSGYRFEGGALDDGMRQFLDLPLPESQRQIGPYPVSTILSVLMGSAWQPSINLANRTVSISASPPSNACTGSGRCTVRVTWLTLGSQTAAGAAGTPQPKTAPATANPAPSGVAALSYAQFPPHNKIRKGEWMP